MVLNKDEQTHHVKTSNEKHHNVTDGFHFVTAWCCSVSNQWRHTVTNKSTYWSVYFVISITFYNSFKINVTMWWFSTSQCDVLKGTTNLFSQPKFRYSLKYGKRSEVNSDEVSYFMLKLREVNTSYFVLPFVGFHF